MNEDYYTYEMTVWYNDESKIKIHIPIELKGNSIIEKRLSYISRHARYYIMLCSKKVDLKYDRENCIFDFQKEEINNDIGTIDYLIHYIIKKLEHYFSPYTFSITPGKNEDEIIFKMYRPVGDD